MKYNRAVDGKGRVSVKVMSDGELEVLSELNRDAQEPLPDGACRECGGTGEQLGAWNFDLDEPIWESCHWCGGSGEE